MNPSHASDTVSISALAVKSDLMSRLVFKTEASTTLNNDELNPCQSVNHNDFVAASLVAADSLANSAGNTNV